jgi:Na+(H+)/acetate symporter ActP
MRTYAGLLSSAFSMPYLVVDFVGIPTLLALLPVIPLAVGVDLVGNLFWAFRGTR